MKYKLNANGNSANIVGTENWVNTYANTEYLLWLSEGNTPEPADILPAPTYQELRAAAYPNILDLIDGLVKDDAAQIQAYKDACLAVKVLYPK